jgi:hypothetical protein
MDRPPDLCGWMLGSGPAHQTRPPRAPARSSADIPLLISAVHHALDCLEATAGIRDHHQACELARSRAASRGWAPPQAWDDAQIDQPDGRPSPDWKPRKRTTRRAVDIVEDAQLVRDHGGYRDADITHIARRLGVSRDQQP